MKPLAHHRHTRRQFIQKTAAAARGVTYGLLEVADRVDLSDESLAGLNQAKPILERPANVIRSISRSFTSDVEDKPWFNDRAFWERYLTLLATQRFNRFSLAFGIGYDFTTNIRDCYFHFAYQFLLAAAVYPVRDAPLDLAAR